MNGNRPNATIFVADFDLAKTANQFLATQIVFSAARLRGIYSLLTVISVAFFVVQFAWFGWWDNILNFIPTLFRREQTWAFPIQQPKLSL
jgi:hypothetical protein